MSDEETEVFYNDRSENLNKSHLKKNVRVERQEKGVLNLSDFADECEIASVDKDAEEASMKKFAKFLEKNGYIQKVNKGGQSKKDMEPEPCSSKDKTVVAPLTKVQQGISSESEVTIYRNTVPLVLNNEGEGDSSQTIDLNTKRISSSSEETESSPNTSSEMIEKRCERLEAKADENRLESNERYLYQKFLDCRLREQRELIRQREKNNDDNNRRPSVAEDTRNVEVTIDERTRNMVKQAEAVKANIFEVSGRNFLNFPVQKVQQIDDGKMESQNQLLHSVVVDEDYAIAVRILRKV